MSSTRGKRKAATLASTSSPAAAASSSSAGKTVVIADGLTLMIDNYDSFTYNLYQYVCELGASNVRVVRNDAITLDECIRLNPVRIIISPGPGKPSESGVSKEVIRHFAGRVPILGVCLGHQAMFEVYGGTVCRADEIRHGKTSPVQHTNVGVFEGLTVGFPATRYHSLVCDEKTLPACLEVTATCQSHTSPDTTYIMGLRHKEYTLQGVQFHPESILCTEGKQLLTNFLQLNTGKW